MYSALFVYDLNVYTNQGWNQLLCSCIEVINYKLHVIVIELSWKK